jgi:hypothetical protein
VPGPTAIVSPTQRDLHILAVDEHGRMNWQKASGYNKRSKVEAAISRYKRIIGDTLKSRHDARRATEGERNSSEPHDKSAAPRKHVLNCLRATRSLLMAKTEKILIFSFQDGA